jgi:hypothetical protein
MRLLVLLMVLVSFQSFSQTVILKKIELGGDKIVVHYDLDDNDPNHFYRIQLFSSKDNFSYPITKVSGDVGFDIRPGMDRKIEWKVFEELKDFKGRISLEIRGKVFIPFARFQSGDLKHAYKRGKLLPLTWSAGNNTPLHIELYRSSEKIHSELNVPNIGSYSLIVPAHAKAGRHYRIKMTSSKTAEDFIYTDFFRIKRRVPLVLKVLPVMAVGAAAAIVIGQSQGNDKGNTGNNGSTVEDPPTLPPG